MDIIKKIKTSMISKFFYFFCIFILHNYCAQEYNSLGKVTKDVIKLYMTEPIEAQNYIGVTIYEDTISKGITIETLTEDFSLYKKAPFYKWFQSNESKIIVFCDFPSKNKCDKIFNAIKLDHNNSNMEISDNESISYELDGGIKQWSVRINNRFKVDRINGKIIESEIVNPKVFKRFLKKHSVLKLYQLEEGGPIISIEK